MNQYLVCPACLLEGRRKILGEVMGGGTIAILRQANKWGDHWGFENKTLITGSDFSLVCGYCRGTVYIQNEHTGSIEINIQITKGTAVYV